MINKFGDFILESQIIELINESNIRVSGNFLDKVKMMSKKNKLAKILFSIFSYEPWVEGDLAQNFIDVAGEDTVSFLSDAKVMKIDWNQETPYIAKGRGTIKVGRFINALLNNPKFKETMSYLIDDDVLSSLEVKSKDIEEFVNLYKATNVDSTKKFKLVKGDDIAKWYYEDKYASDKGTLGSSCMKDVGSNYFNIYVKNDKVCRLLIYINNENKLLGRALVWKLNEAPCDAEYFMDRVYCNNDSDILKFTAYAEEQGWLYKYRMNSGDAESLLFKYNGGFVFGKIEIKLKESEFDEYPYCDTLTFLNIKDKTLSNVGSKNCQILSSTSGGSDTCDNCGGKGYEECNWCDGDGEQSCEDCGGDGEYTCPDCDGSGETGRGKNKKECEKCKGEGVVKCEECDGKGETECSRCHGKIVEECESCVGLEDYVRKQIREEGEFKEFKSIIEEK